MSGESEQFVWVTVFCEMESVKAFRFTDHNVHCWVKKRKIRDREEEIRVGNDVQIQIPLKLAQNIGFQT